jgi:hypothetical protein
MLSTPMATVSTVSDEVTILVCVCVCVCELDLVHAGNVVGSLG